jgi:hypothetical protein
VRKASASRIVKLKIDREIEDRKNLDAAPGMQSFVSQLVAGTLDLPTLIPGGWFVRGVRGGVALSAPARGIPAWAEAGGWRTAANLPLVAAEATGKAVARAGRVMAPMATLGAAGSATQELALHTLSETRTAAESGFNIGAAAFLSGLCGSAGARLPE